MEPMKLILVEAIIDLAAFIDMADEDTVDTDAAADRLEHLATGLQQMTKEERQEFLVYVKEVARAKESRGTNSELIDWILTFGRDLGLED